MKNRTRITSKGNAQMDKQSHLTVTLRGGIDVWGVKFVQWLERELDTISRFERIGKSITDDRINIYINLKPVVYIGPELNVDDQEATK